MQATQAQEPCTAKKIRGGRLSFEFSKAACSEIAAAIEATSKGSPPADSLNLTNQLLQRLKTQVALDTRSITLTEGDLQILFRLKDALTTIGCKANRALQIAEQAFQQQANERKSVVGRPGIAFNPTSSLPRRYDNSSH
jgi:hypothetical protein